MLPALFHRLLSLDIRHSEPFGNVVDDHPKALAVLVDEAKDLVILSHLRTTQEETRADRRLVALSQLCIASGEDVRGFL